MSYKQFLAYLAITLGIVFIIFCFVAQFIQIQDRRNMPCDQYAREWPSQELPARCLLELKNNR